MKGPPIKGQVKSSPDNVPYFLSQNCDRSYISWPFRYLSLVDPAASTMISLFAEKVNLYCYIQEDINGKIKEH